MPSASFIIYGHSFFFRFGVLLFLIFIGNAFCVGGVDRSTDGNSRSSAHIQHHPVNGVRAELMISIALESLCVQAYRRNNIISNHKSRIPFCFLFFHGSLLLRLIIFNGDRIGSIAWRNSFFYISKNLGHLNKKETEK